MLCHLEDLFLELATLSQCSDVRPTVSLLTSLQILHLHLGKAISNVEACLLPMRLFHGPALKTTEANDGALVSLYRSRSWDGCKNRRGL